MVCPRATITKIITVNNTPDESIASRITFEYTHAE